MKEKLRTKEKAGDVVEQLPTSLVVPTLCGYQFATSFYPHGKAYLQLLKKDAMAKLTFRDGNTYFDGARNLTGYLDEYELQNITTNECIEDIDLPLLRSFYSIILSEFENTGYKDVRDIIKLYVPDFAQYLGLDRDINKKDIANIVKKVQALQNILGILYFENTRKTSYYPALCFEGYNSANNTIAFSSPYMNRAVEETYNASIRRNSSGEAQLKKNGSPLRTASHSYLIKSKIAKERNKAAVENVFIICQVIEQTGNNMPHVKASTLIERNPQLKERLQNNPQSNRLLQRVFNKTWELLENKTKLKETYEDIQLPELENSANIPTMKTLNVVFSFSHKGKKQNT